MAKSHRYYAKSSRSHKRHQALWSALRWSLGLVVTIYLSWLILFPAFSGAIGRWLADKLFLTFGWASYLLPVMAVNLLIRTFQEGRPAGNIIISLVSLAAMAAGSAVLALTAGWCGASAAAGGGFLGRGLGEGLANALGGVGAFLLCFAILLVTLQAVMGVRWSTVAGWLAAAVAEDFKRWQRDREELKSRIARAPKGDAAVKDTCRKEIHPAGACGTSDTAGGAAPPEPVNLNEERAKARAVKAACRKEIRPAGACGTSDTAGGNKKYQLPPLDLLNPTPSAANCGRPLESEIKTTVMDLERTFKDFGIEARVTGYAPGPVITRYEVSPAPGVKVSSIVVLQNDVALALKAKGIRIIAPIPGKAAVGIEIPNARPALVVLRDVLESRAIPPDAPLLTFAVGLSSSGEPLAADLQKMPHLLVAGATNSGKSVFMHSLILSILYRARPEEVKFLLIDPKRLELTFY
ncbi:MAG: DNA translocase FtsK 4TM domain-containing protein, partial [Elusimicrobiota bacterium]